ncbi:MULTISPECIES: type II secretion system minor pseudopilin GspI [unclassified Cupriavidus]|uniref:type II secretion system minor pseudopilin GspI n=1 Tax=unclassified Cupriavidus TaxID=2640874 RepID=UPI0013653434|nr:type II secretion system minor pseudopilin GspI [Cupriavidus sp. SW-Y-13]MWL88732.1 type II secretion system protein GspI [Cupriavidus sp. SW-Y-13]
MIRRAHRPHPPGFTLIEVLVALTILAVALTAAMRAMGSMTESSASLQQRMLAEFSAENHLATLRLSRTWPEPGSRGYECPQGGVPLYCQETVSGTPNPSFRRVEIAVFPSATDKSVRLAWLVTLVPNETRNVL